MSNNIKADEAKLTAREKEFVKRLDSLIELMWTDSLTKDHPLDMIELRLPKYLYPGLQDIHTNFGKLKVKRRRL